jgi:hypothetical protein
MHVRYLLDELCLARDGASQFDRERTRERVVGENSLEPRILDKDNWAFMAGYSHLPHSCLLLVVVGLETPGQDVSDPPVPLFCKLSTVHRFQVWFCRKALPHRMSAK